MERAPKVINPQGLSCDISRVEVLRTPSLSLPWFAVEMISVGRQALMAYPANQSVRQ